MIVIGIENLIYYCHQNLFSELVLQNFGILELQDRCQHLATESRKVNLIMDFKCIKIEVGYVPPKLKKSDRK